MVESTVGVDEDYPTDEQLRQIEDFAGTPIDFVDMVSDVWPDMGTLTIDKGGPERRPATVYRFVTGGWSGCESVLSSIERTMFHMLFWRESHRGGLVVYEVPDSQLDWNLPALNLPPWEAPCPTCQRQHQEDRHDQRSE